MVFVLRNYSLLFVRNVKAIPLEFQHALVIADLEIEEEIDENKQSIEKDAY